MTHCMADQRAFLTGLFLEAVKAADPMISVSGHLPARPNGRLLVIGAGKASARMAEAVEAHYGPCEGLVITRYGYARPCAGVEIIEAAHPLPDAAGMAATQRMLKIVNALGPNDLVLALISGGGSALLCAPAEGVTLADLIAVNSALLASGATISEMNIIRKRLSAVKGGRLAAACYPARILNLLISDVPGDDPGMIASGPTVFNTGTRDETADPLEIAARYYIDLPLHIRSALAKAPSCITPPASKPGRIETRIIAAPSKSLKAAAERAKAAGSDVHLLGDALEGEARDLGAAQARRALEIQSKMRPGEKPVLLLSGGECTVSIQGNGVGGPNAEFVLSAAITLNGACGIHILAGDTDGVDGMAEVAGAFAGPDTLSIASALGIRAQRAHETNDAHSFFEKVGGQIITGPTLTNVNDFRAILIEPA